MEKKRLRFSPIFWGLVLITAAVLLILDGVGVGLGEGIGPVRIILGVGFFAWFLYELIRLRISAIFFPLAFLFITFKKPIAALIGKDGSKLISNWTVLLAALLLTIGFIVLLPKRKKQPENKVKVGNRFGTSTIYLDSTDLNGATVADIFGSAQVYFTNRESYAGGGVVNICDNMGNIVVHVPGDWQVITTASDNLGNVSVPEHEGVAGKSLELRITDNMGKITVVFEY